MVHSVLSWIYPASSLVILLLYLPQIRSVMISRRAEGVAVSTWAVWTICMFISTLYGGIVLMDVSVAIGSFGNMFCCLLMTLATIYRRRVG